MMKLILAVSLLFVATIAVAAPPPCDFNGDGYEDIAVWVAEKFPGSLDVGFVHVIYGSQSGLTATNNQVWHRDSPGVLGESRAGELFGAAFACGDFNFDANTDLAIESPGVSGRLGTVNVLYGSSSGLTATGNQLWTPDSPGIVAADWRASLASGDFNGDNFFDLAIGADFVGHEGVGILYGSSSGLSSANYQFFHQNTPGIEEVSEPGDPVGMLVAANFGKDDASRCYDDLAFYIGESFGLISDGEESEPLHPNAGAVHVLYGSANGLTATGSLFVHQDTSGIPGSNGAFDEFGSVMAAGVFRANVSACGERVSDLAIGIPGDLENRGALQILYSSSSNAGLIIFGNQLWTQNSAGVPEQSEPGDRYGAALASGRASSGRDYLAVGVPGESFTNSAGTLGTAGAVQVFFTDSASRRLTATGIKHYNQNTSGISDFVEASDRFGSSLSAGNFNGAGMDDLAIGVPNEDFSGLSDAGLFHVLYGANTVTTQLWSQNSTGIKDTAESGDFFSFLLSN